MEKDIYEHLLAIYKKLEIIGKDEPEAARKIIIRDAIPFIKNIIELYQSETEPDDREYLLQCVEEYAWRVYSYVTEDLDLIESENFFEDNTFFKKKHCKIDRYLEGLKITAKIKDFRQENILEVTVNKALPNMRNDPIQLQVYNAKFKPLLQRQLQQIQCPEYTEVVIVFEHHYTKRYCKDTDNYYKKPISDGLSECLFRYGDGPAYVQYFVFSVEDKVPMTVAYVVPACVFLDWLKMEKDEFFCKEN